MKRSAPARIVNLSSLNHKKGQVDFSHFHCKVLSGRKDQMYNNTKLHIVLCTKELAHRLQGTGRPELAFQLCSFVDNFVFLGQFS